ncbi:DNA polymerase subunit gamma-2, mitochondrial isoform X3 [Triplophysa rosa]|uniref:DNA polymerase subunit gamma-2, mitochondrial isoform X3 n=1 Tax=Triplophysa rosa TaxID=992332 RepID=UPI00254602C6|nr:DNA polymerase subunit gamma-2, mitochondrial isoform X3 [Triplophysa rosa]
MLPLYCRKRILLLGENLSRYLQHSSKHNATTGDGCDQVSLLLRLCEERHFISPDAFHTRTCVYGPLGTELKKNILEQWWTAATRSRARVFGINTSVHTRTCALQQYIQALELVSRKLPFGLAEIGLCHQSNDQSFGHSPGCLSEVTESSLVWFCSPRTSSQWMDYWARQRLQWWRKVQPDADIDCFALGPSDFSLCDVVDKDLKDGTLRGIKVLYKFPWGLETLETLWSLGNTELQKTYQGTHSKLQCRDGRKVVVPHVISISGDMDKGMLAYLFNSLKQLKKTDSKQKQQTVLKLHPTLTPVKVALDMGRGSNSELRQVCEGLLQEFLEEGIPTWPGYLDTLPLSLENLHTKYDEMGVLFTVLVSETTLKNGLLLVRNRDTTIRETMHITEIKGFLLRYMYASENL